MAAASRLAKSIRFWPSCCARSRSVLIPMPCPRPSSGFTARRLRLTKRNFARSGKFTSSRSANETVEEDLRQLAESEKPFSNSTLRIPCEHSEAWLNTLNQARLAIAAKFDFTEAELSDHYRSPIGSRRDLSLFQVNFYGFLQEFILRELECSVEPIVPNE